MKKVMKAAIAAGAAGALLLGGAGTMALWSADTDINAGTVSTGHLTLDSSAAGAWADASADAASTIFDPATDHLVPGDTVEFSQTVTIGADGKNLKGELTVGDLASAVPTELADDVTVTVAAAPTDPNLTVVGSTVSFAEPGTYDVPVTITVAFAAGTAGSTADTTMDTPMDLTALSLTLNQVRP
ncbi:MAG: alternate-type signal peptide domain-containing protein [Specibacter sp.]